MCHDLVFRFWRKLVGTLEHLQLIPKAQNICVDGIENIVKFLQDSMRGLEDWTFPLEWMAVEGDYLITGWQNRLPGRRPDGTYFQAPGMSRIRYAGDGKFDYEQDLINMVHMLEVMKESGWKPGEGFQNPPRDRVRLCAWEP